MDIVNNHPSDGFLSLERLGNTLSADHPILFGAENSKLRLDRGWAPREHSFCWTIGPFAEIVLDLDARAGLIGIDCAPLIIGSRDRAQTLLFANGVLVCAEVILRRKIISFSIPAGCQQVALIIWVPDAVSPVSLDPTIIDDRQLGLQVFSISYTPNKA